MLKKSEDIFHLIIIFIITILLIHSELIGNLIWKLDPLIYKVFGDHNTPIDWLQCHSLGIDLLKNYFSFQIKPFKNFRNKTITLLNKNNYVKNIFFNLADKGFRF